MPLQISQTDRPLKATTPLGEDVLIPVDIMGEEAVSEPFLFTVDFVSERAGITAADLLGKPVTLHLLLADESIRDIHGLVRRFSNLGTSRYLTHYRAEIVPTLWFLSLSNDCRTFEKMTVLDIVEQVCRDAGLTDFKRRVAATPPQLPYVVQYRETNLAFVSRLLEDAGLYYTFEHESGSHTLVFSDSQALSIPPGLVETVKVDSQFMGNQPQDDTVFRFSREFAVHAKSVSLADHDLLRTDNVGSASSSKAGVRGERFAFLGDLGPNRSAAEATLLIEVEEAAYDIVRGESSCPAFQSGTRVKMTEGPLSSAGEDFHLLRVLHRATIGDVHASGGLSATYGNQFVALPAATRYRPPRTTPRPSVRGTQTAKIVGTGGDGAIDVDADGRVLIEFPWDRGKGKDAGSQHRVHVASVWSGTQWGFVQIPRVGQEVVVEFLEGDLERPIITGRVFNTTHKTLYDLPANKTQSGWKSRTLEGGSDNFNELRFEDKKGSEHVYLQAEKDFNIVVKNDETRDVRHDRKTDIKNNDTRTVKEGNDAHTVSKGNQTVTIDKGNQTIGVTQGNIAIKADAGKINIEAGTSIELKVGSNTILIDSSGITMKGMNVKAEAKLAAETKATTVKIEGSAQTQVKAPMTQVNGDGTLILKGGITLIN